MGGIVGEGSKESARQDAKNRELGIPAVSLPRVPKLALYSAIPPQPLLQLHHAGFIASPSDRADLQRLWERANRAYARSTRADRSLVTDADIRSLEDVDQSRMDAVLSRARLYPPFDSHQPELVAVKVSKLISAQLTVSIPRANRRSSVPRDATDAELLAVSTTPSTTDEPVNHQVLGQAPGQGGAVIFTSYDEDVRPHDPVFRNLQLETRDASSQVLSNLCIPVGGGIPFIQAFRIAVGPGVDRVALSNGFHRAYAVARAGCEWIPVVMTRLDPLEMPPQFIELPSPLIVNPMANPPVVTDFLNEEAALRLEYYPVLKVVRVNWGVEQYSTVLK